MVADICAARVALPAGRAAWAAVFDLEPNPIAIFDSRMSTPLASSQFTPYRALPSDGSRPNSTAGAFMRRAAANKRVAYRLDQTSIHTLTSLSPR